MPAIRKSETCEDQLRRMCRSIADSIDTPEMITDEETGEKRYLGCELLVAGGGPTIWVNTWTKEVEGYWGGDKVLEPFIDNIGLDDYNEEMYNCI